MKKQTLTEKTIYDFVAKNYGKSEADDPSWNISALAEAIDTHQKAPEFYMVIACFRNSIRDNLEIVDYNLSFDDAQDLALNIQYPKPNSPFNDEDWELDVREPNYIKIVPQATKL